MRNTERLYDRVIEKMDMTCDMEDEELQELIHEVLEEASKEEFIPLQEKIRISKELFNAFRKLDILQELIEDDEITEIMINGMCDRSGFDLMRLVKSSVLKFDIM